MDLLIIMQIDVHEVTENVNPMNAYTYGFLVFCLVSAVIMLWRYIHKIVQKYIDITENIITKNTNVLEKYNDVMERKVEGDSELKEKMITLITTVKMNEDKHANLIEKVSTNEARNITLISKMEMVIEKMNNILSDSNNK